MMFYSGEPNFFNEQEIHLLQEIVDNISFALEMHVKCGLESVYSSFCTIFCNKSGESAITVCEVQVQVKCEIILLAGRTKRHHVRLLVSSLRFAALRASSAHIMPWFYDIT
jgi:hypothetical protein